MFIPPWELQSRYIRLKRPDPTQVKQQSLRYWWLCSVQRDIGPNTHALEHAMTDLVPRPLSDAEVKQLQALQTVFDPAASLKRVDDFSKWIFASIGVIGSLGAAFSNSAFSTLAPCGKDIFGIAV